MILQEKSVARHSALKIDLLGMDVIDGLINKLIDGLEGDYSDDTADAGGATRFGITEALARTYGYTGAMRDLPRDFALQVYRREFWQKPKLDVVLKYDAPLAALLFQFAVNSSAVHAIKELQRALNVLCQNTLNADGCFGPSCETALKSFIGKRGKEGLSVLRGMIKAQQSVYYIEIAEKNPSQEKFEYGWQKNRAFNDSFE